MERHASNPVPGWPMEIKVLGFLPGRRLLWNADMYADWTSNHQFFSTIQVAIRCENRLVTDIFTNNQRPFARSCQSPVTPDPMMKRSGDGPDRN